MSRITAMCESDQARWSPHPVVVNARPDVLLLVFGTSRIIHRLNFGDRRIATIGCR